MKPLTYARQLSRLRRVACHVDSHLDQPLSLAELAEVAHLSRYHFERVFTSYAGETPVARVRRLRLALARQQLEAGSPLSMLELALESGYGSAEAFSRAFRAAFGMPPSAVRPQARQQGSIHIETLASRPIQYLHFEGRLGRDLTPFDELRAHALLAGIPRERRKGWCVELAGDMGRSDQPCTLQAALLAEPLGQTVPGLQHGELPGGHYAVLRLTGGFALPSAEELAARVHGETGWRLIADAPRLRCFHNASYLPAEFERCFDLYLPVEPDASGATKRNTDQAAGSAIHHTTQGSGLTAEPDSPKKETS